MLLQFNTIYDRDEWFNTYPEIPSLVFIEQTKELFIWKSKWIKLTNSLAGTVLPRDTPPSNADLRFISFKAPLQAGDKLFIELPKFSKYVESFGYVDVGFEFRPLKVLEQIENKVFFDCFSLEYTGLLLNIMVSSGGVSPIQFLQDLNTLNEEFYAVGQLFMYERSMYVYALDSDYPFDIQMPQWKGGLIQLSNKGVTELKRDVLAVTHASNALRVVTFKPLSSFELQSLHGILVLRADGTFLLPYNPAKDSANTLKVSIVTRNAEATNNVFVHTVTGYYATPLQGKTMQLASIEFPHSFIGCQVIPESYLTYDVIFTD